MKSPPCLAPQIFIISPAMRLILASGSPRRRALLEVAGFEFDVEESGIEEAAGPGERAEAFAGRVAREKALRVAAVRPPEDLILGADTVVAVDGEILGKPADAPQARRMLQRLSGRAHHVHTALCLVRAPRNVVAEALESTRVTFRDLDAREIEDYVASGEPFDKAGAYGIQGRASKFVSGLEGSYSNVVGLPVERVTEMLGPLMEGGLV
jgi:nucleoside triphosphate pyrophosphatase